MPSAERWTLRAPDGTTIRRAATIKETLAEGVPPGATLKRERVTFSKGPQARAPKTRQDAPPVVPPRKAQDAPPMPGERIDANGNAIRRDGR